MRSGTGRVRSKDSRVKLRTKSEQEKRYSILHPLHFPTVLNCSGFIGSFVVGIEGSGSAAEVRSCLPSVVQDYRLQKT